MSLDRRGLVAAVLSFLYPGVGHLYLRKWVRAIAWFALAMLTAAVLVPDAAFEAFRQGGVGAMLQIDYPIETTLGLLAVRLTNVVDAYLVAVRSRGPAAAGPGPGADEEATCPACGKELDRDLDFCPWCTTELEWVEPGDERYDPDRS
ncbi:zinc ribbon domain-containing protein [Halospeciosus flavus]|uniref:Zinc ribbon domain-containing protein n=1 Tax=Halospeciosus flavus TaxID=3032283 RepID=A0ABD5Z5U3_9EURY|nr:zinc ribbon domain-containing protein [Halospeciosus flavus]